MVSSLKNSPLAFADTNFFYRNLHIQEVLSTLRHGIEARKGLITLTGEAGSGKTILLQKVSAELPANVTCIFEPDPRLGFVEVLRLILRNLNCEIPDEGEPELLRTCKLQLRSRAERCQIVSLILDNAHHLPDQTLRHITQNFTGASAEDPNGSLLQLVLSGRPELTSKLSQAALVPLRRRRPIICQLHPLSNREIATFIQQGLESNSHPAQLFDERAIKRIALYAQGNPRSVNALCDRAMQLAGATVSITPELIEGAAGDLDLHASAVLANRGDREASEEMKEQDHSADFQFRPEDFTDVGGQSFPPPYVAERHNAVGSRRRTHWPRNVMIVAILAACAAMIRTEIGSTVPADWSARLKQLAQLPAPSHPVQAKTETSVEKVIKEEPPIRVPGPDFPSDSPQNDSSNTLDSGLATAKVSNDAEALSPSSVENATSERPVRIAPDNGRSGNKERRAPLKARSDPDSENLQSQVAKAIESRAIMGVEVSVMHGTAYLDGRVATERQRRAAERAARSVAGVERVRNRIAISYG
jgi:type II secretory pathway predicted ATPase ExeA